MTSSDPMDGVNVSTLVLALRNLLTTLDIEISSGSTFNVTQYCKLTDCNYTTNKWKCQVAVFHQATIQKFGQQKDFMVIINKFYQQLIHKTNCPSEYSQRAYISRPYRKKNHMTFLMKISKHSHLSGPEPGQLSDTSNLFHATGNLSLFLPSSSSSPPSSFNFRLKRSLMPVCPFTILLGSFITTTDNYGRFNFLLLLAFSLGTPASPLLLTRD
ncbi:hypothetical protein MP228_001296 [Amoeboaphelidium protococcarum]|nr:hypothetical protein MP228_001296 [Amoeboaphelidium protococcarum]